MAAHAHVAAASGTVTCALVLLAASSPAHATVEITGIEGPPADNVRAFLLLDDLACAEDERAIRREFAPARASA